MHSRLKLENQCIPDSTSKRSPPFEHTKPLTREHSREATIRVPDLEKKGLLSTVRGTDSRQERQKYFFSGAILRRGLQA